MPRIEIKPSGSNYELWVDGVRTATGTLSSIQNMASRYGSAPAQSAQVPQGTTSSPQSPATQTPKLPIPDEVYIQIRQSVIDGSRTPADALAYMQALGDSAQYSGGFDRLKLFPPGFAFVSNGGNYQFDNTGTGGRIKTTATVQQTNVTPQGVTTTTSSTPPSSTVTLDAMLAEIDARTDLDADQKAVLKEIASAQFTGDTAKMQRLIAGVQAVTPYANVYFKAQAALVLSALKSGLEGQTTDVQFSKDKLQGQLDDLKADIAASRGNLDFEKTQALQKLARSYETDLETLRQKLAVSGKTFSSVRDRSEQLLKEQQEGLVQSTTQKFSFETGKMGRQEESALRDYQTNLAYLTNQDTQKRISMLREAEKQVGSPALATAGYTPPVPDVPGDLPYQYKEKILSGGAKVAGF